LSEVVPLAATLLIAEDDVFIRAMIAEFLRDSGFDVVEAGNADEAIGVLESGAEIDLLFSDVKMPGSMDGCGLAEHVRRNWPGTKVILTSGYSASLLKARGSILDAVLPKPYRPLSVLAAVLSAVEP
jgi:CheY-like chemotaxis protein